MCKYPQEHVSISYLNIQNDLAIIAVDRRAKEYLCEKKLFNYDEAHTNAVICEEQLPKLYREIIHRFGASSQWTQGEIVLSEFVSENQGIIAVRGMNKRVLENLEILCQQSFVRNSLITNDSLKLPLYCLVDMNKTREKRALTLNQSRHVP